jgi:nitroreductase
MNSSLVRGVLLSSISIISLLAIFGCASNKGTVIMTNRSSQYSILDAILHRWSPRAMSGEPISEKELMTILEAGRWAPSSYNNQPWHFVYGIKGTPAWNTLFDLLVPFNQSWCKNGGALVCVIAAKNFFKKVKPSRTHLLDTGAAWENMAIQATSMGLVSHGMEGFDYEKAHTALHIPDTHEVVMIFVIGKPAPASTLPSELAQREEPSDRVPLDKIISEGIFENKRQ